MNLKILPSANEDLINGYYFYNRQAEGVGNYFLDSLFSDIDSLLIYHGVHPVLLDRYYRMLSRRFPFAVYYTIEHDDVIVHAVLDCRKNPAGIKQKLEKNDQNLL